jgi:hypothetical protein
MPDWRRLRALLGRPEADAGPQSTDYLWDPDDTRSFEALRRSGEAGPTPPRPRSRPAQRAAVQPEVGGAAGPLEELPEAPAEPSPLLRRRPVVLGGSVVLGALLALLLGTAFGAFDSEATEAEVEAAFEQGFADGRAAAEEVAEDG